METQSGIFGPLRDLCIYNRTIFRTLAYLKPEASSKACQIYYDQVHSEPWHSQNSLFKHFQGYLGIFRDTDADSAALTDVQLGGEGRPP